jgi:hypothetical protein
MDCGPACEPQCWARAPAVASGGVAEAQGTELLAGEKRVGVGCVGKGPVQLPQQATIIPALGCLRGCVRAGSLLGIPAQPSPCSGYAFVFDEKNVITHSSPRNIQKEIDR